MKKVLSIVLCLMMLLGSMVITVGAEEPTNKHALKDNALLKAYGISSVDVEDNEDGSNAAVGAAAIKSADGTNSYLEIKIGESSSYPTFQIDAVPTTLSNYTYSVDMIVAENVTNKLITMAYGKTAAGKVATLGFRYGKVTEGKAWSSVVAQNGPAPTGTFYFGVSEGLENVPQAELGARINYEVTVNKKLTGTEVTLKIGGVVVPVQMPEGADMGDSFAGFSAWKTNIYGYDNFKVVDNSTGLVVYEEDFEDHTWGSDVKAVDDEFHGVTCLCGTADAVAHDYDNGVDVDDPTSCGDHKAKKYTCATCEHTKTVGKDHTPGEPVITGNPCEEDCTKTVTCTACGDKIEETVLPKTGHTFGLWEKTDNGKKRTCTNCGEVEEEVKETEAPKTTEAPKADAAATTAKAEEKSGCGSVVMLPAFGITLLGAAVCFKKRKED